jgi:hypothetical protein
MTNLINLTKIYNKKMINPKGTKKQIPFINTKTTLITFKMVFVITYFTA